MPLPALPSLDDLKSRHVVRWGLTYLAGAWLALQVVAILGATYAWPGWLLRAVPVVLAVGFLAALVLAWYHGERGAQKVSRVEATILASLLVVAGFGVLAVGGGPAETAGATGSEVGLVALADAADRASVAVLPFENMSGDPDQAFFSDGLTEELLATMARIPGLRVAARTSSFAFRDRAAPADSIGRTLGVASLVEGSVRRVGHRARITARLVDAKTGTETWTGTYERAVTDVFAVQDEVARAVARELRVRVGGEPLAEAPTRDTEAYESVLRGRAAHERRAGPTAEWTAEAMRHFRAALARDSAYAAAWAGLAGIHSSRAYLGVADDAEAEWVLARAAAERALTLDPNDAEAHNVLGWAAGVSEGDWAAAGGHFERVLLANPSHAQALARYARAQSALGRRAESVRAAERAAALDPLSFTVLINAGLVYYIAREFGRAAEQARAALALVPENPVALGNLANALSSAGEHEEAVRHAERVATLLPEHPVARATLAGTYARAGRRAEAERAAAALPAGAYVYRASVAVALGERDRAFALLDRAAAAGDVVTATGLEAEPAFDGLHGDPRWTALLDGLRAAEGGG